MYLADTLSRAYIEDKQTEPESEEIEAINMIKDQKKGSKKFNNTQKLTHNYKS